MWDLARGVGRGPDGYWGRVQGRPVLDTPTRKEPRRVTSYLNGSLRFDVLDSGPLDGQVVVLLHGFPERASHWEAVAERLHAEGLRTVAPDQRGYSPGARPRTRAAYRLTCLVDDVVALVREIGEPVHLVGHDWGAAVAWRAAGEHAELVNTLTTISVPHPSAFSRSLLRSSQAVRSWYVLAFQPPILIESIARVAPGMLTRPLRASGMDEDGVRRFERDFLAFGALPGALGWYRAIPMGSLAAMKPVTVPTTHVWPTEEVALSERGAKDTARYVEAPYQLVRLPGATHWAPTQQPAAVAQVILDRVAAHVDSVQEDLATRSDVL
jgi:pimeloyl-ACP methyl ester carboxylesterase